jgi:N-methylhydantoinase B/oxoprolinase/acetone carboxylase alpha subunit
MAKPSESRWKARTKQDLILEVWEALDCDSVGARELEQIQGVLSEKFGEGALASPAAIARTVADEGAVLRHPEVFECDFKWRKQVAEALSFQSELDFSRLSIAFESMVRVEEQRLKFQTEADANGQAELRNIIRAAQKDCVLRARSKIIEEGQREEAKEISNWLGVWLQTPELFSDWLDLRRSSPEFQKKFSQG